MRRYFSTSLFSLACACACAVFGCTHTVDGTGGPSAGTSGTPAASATGPTSACVSVSGVWEVRPGVAEGCESDSCTIAQAECALTLRCSSGTYTGTIANDQLSWSGSGDASCSASVGPQGLRVDDGTCVGNAGACTFSATKR